MSDEDGELYFAYASLMLPGRMACCSKDAKVVDIGKVQVGMLSFHESWCGHSIVCREEYFPS